MLDNTTIKLIKYKCNYRFSINNHPVWFTTPPSITYLVLHCLKKGKHTNFIQIIKMDFKTKYLLRQAGSRND